MGKENKGVPLRDGSGGGTRKNKNRGGCAKPAKLPVKPKPKPKNQ